MSQRSANPLDQTTHRPDSTASSGSTLVTGMRWVFPVEQAHSTWFVEPRTLLGRGEDCDERLRGQETSRHHAQIWRDGPIHIVRDVASTNGVFVNGVRVGEAVLSSGDVLRLGDCIGIVVQGNPAPDIGAMRVSCDHGIVAGPVLQPILAVARQSALLGLPIVIQGETGTGKELVARAIHAWSTRSGQFIAINCAALAQSLAEAELFGYRKGAFTGADRSSEGYFRAADGGTLLLDEISDLPLTIQPKLLRVLEQREVVRVGESRPIGVDVRLLAATQTSLSEKATEGTFRSDLLARLEGVVVRLPSLRERLEEVPALFDWFVRKHSGGLGPTIDPRVVEALCLYDWPRNVRELSHLARQLVGLHGSESRIKYAHLPPRFRAPGGTCAPPNGEDRSEGLGAKQAREVASLVRALRLMGGNVSRAAAEVGISRQRAYRLLAVHPEIDPEALRRACRAAKSNEPQDDAP